MHENIEVLSNNVMFRFSQHFSRTLIVGVFNRDKLYNISAFESYLSIKYGDCGVENIRNIPCPVKCPIHAINDVIT